MSVLSIRELSITFATPNGPIEAVREVSLDVERGETVAIVGASGSGKSTTAAAINRLLPPNGRISHGSVWFDDVDVAAIPERRMRRLRGAEIGFVPQDPMANLNPVMRVGDQIAEALEVHGVLAGRAADGRAVELLEMVGIDAPARRARQYPHEFSGGMRQRALIAVGLACRPRLLVADEPTSALDVTVQRRILDLIGELTAEMDTAVVLITHDLGLAAERADRVVVMNAGAIVEAGPAHQVVGHPTDDYTRRLIAAAPNVATVSIAPPRPPDAETAPPLVVVERLAKSFALRDSGDVHVAVDDVSFTIPPATTVAIVGESGSGKSTTANMVLGLETPTAGAIRFEGADITGMGRDELFAFRRRVQPVFQNPYSSLDPRYTVGRSIAEPLRVHGLGDRASRRASVTTLLEQVALAPELAGRYPHELSGGQRQRVAIARALALSPELIVLDEAVSALDVMVQAQILELLVGLQRQLGLAYLFISHDLAVVRMISHVVHVMQRGRIVESGTPAELFADPRDPYTRELLAAIPSVA